MVLLGWGLALLSAVCYGVASALQAVAARSTRAARGMDVTLLVRLMRRGWFLVSILLDLVGFASQVLALQLLPLYVVQAVQASNLAVTAVAAVPLLHIRLRAGEWGAIGAVCGGLILLGASAGRQGDVREPQALGISLVITAAVVVLLGWLVGRWHGRVGSAVLGTLAGIEFTIVALAARSLTTPAPLVLLRQPATYALAIAGIFGFLFLTTGLQRGAVTTVTGAVVVAETLLPAAIGVMLLGDRTRSGMVPLAVLGFVAAVAGALALARFGEVESPERPAGDGDRAAATPAGGRPGR